MAQHLKHMAWANQEVFQALSGLNDSALSSYIVNPEWTVGEIVRHIASSNDWYGFRLSERKPTELVTPLSMKDVVEVAKLLANFDKHLLEQSELPESEIVINREGVQTRWMRSTILSQSIHHCTEHRAQLVDALEFKGFTTINLDDFDVWAFELHERRNQSK